METPKTKLTHLDLVAKCDAFPGPETNPAAHSEKMQGFWTIMWGDGDDAFPLGYMPDSVYQKVLATEEEWLGTPEVNDGARTVRLFQDFADESARTDFVAELTEHWRAHKTFDALRAWCNERLPVYGRDGELLFSMERAAVGLFGMARYGVHMTAYTMTQPKSGDSTTSKYRFRVWVSKRSPNKSTYPNMLDQTAAGGMATGELDPLDALVREANEEASLPEELVRGSAKAFGTVTYMYLTGKGSGGEENLVYPECQWVYDLELPAEVVPVPKDGEVAGFKLETVEEVLDQLARGLWKPNCALVMVDFLIRHGVVTPETEPHYDEICRRMRRKLPFPKHPALLEKC